MKQPQESVTFQSVDEMRLYFEQMMQRQNINAKQDKKSNISQTQGSRPPSKPVPKPPQNTGNNTNQPQSQVRPPEKELPVQPTKTEPKKLGSERLKFLEKKEEIKKPEYERKKVSISSNVKNLFQNKTEGKELKQVGQLDKNRINNLNLFGKEIHLSEEAQQNVLNTTFDIKTTYKSCCFFSMVLPEEIANKLPISQQELFNAVHRYVSDIDQSGEALNGFKNAESGIILIKMPTTTMKKYLEPIRLCYVDMTQSICQHIQQSETDEKTFSAVKKECEEIGSHFPINTTDTKIMLFVNTLITDYLKHTMEELKKQFEDNRLDENKQLKMN